MVSCGGGWCVGVLIHIFRSWAAASSLPGPISSTSNRKVADGQPNTLPCYVDRRWSYCKIDSPKLKSGVSYNKVQTEHSGTSKNQIRTDCERDKSFRSLRAPPGIAVHKPN
eukprot:812852-Amphidinium_carterae.1